MNRNQKRALAKQAKRNDARAVFMAEHRGSRKAFDGSAPNTIDGKPAFKMASRPGYTPCRSQYGTTIRSGKKSTLKFQRPNPAAGEEPMANPVLASHHAIERETGEIVQLTDPVGTSTRAAYHPAWTSSVGMLGGEKVARDARTPHFSAASRAA